LQHLNHVRALPERFFYLLVEEFVALEVKGGVNAVLVVDGARLGFFVVYHDRLIGLEVRNCVVVILHLDCLACDQKML